MEIDTIFESDDVVVINKPSGVWVHEDGTDKGETVVDWLLGRAPEVAGVGEPGKGPKGEELERSGVVHRLDGETSGVLILAKTPEAFVHLKAQFQNRVVKKEYRAFVYGHMRDKWGTIDRPIGRSAKDHRRRSAESGAKGTLREAVTNWELIGFGEYQNEPFSYVKLKPQTGRTHQLRVHLRSLDRPIVMDTLYAEHKIPTSNNLNLSRLALHAHILEIMLPHGEAKRFIAPMPQAFLDAADKLGE